MVARPLLADACTTCSDLPSSFTPPPLAAACTTCSHLPSEMGARNKYKKGIGDRSNAVRASVSRGRTATIHSDIPDRIYTVLWLWQSYHSAFYLKTDKILKGIGDRSTYGPSSLFFFQCGRLNGGNLGFVERC